jgi:hypothetical protein
MSYIAKFVTPLVFEVRIYIQIITEPYQLVFILEIEIEQMM